MTALPIISPPSPLNTEIVCGVVAISKKLAAKSGVKNIISPNAKDAIAVISKKVCLVTVIDCQS